MGQISILGPFNSCWRSVLIHHWNQSGLGCSIDLIHGTKLFHCVHLLKFYRTFEQSGGIFFARREQKEQAWRQRLSSFSSCFNKFHGYLPYLQIQWFWKGGSPTANFNFNDPPLLHTNEPAHYLSPWVQDQFPYGKDKIYCSYLFGIDNWFPCKCVTVEKYKYSCAQHHNGRFTACRLCWIILSVQMVWGIGVLTAQTRYLPGLT